MFRYFTSDKVTVDLETVAEVIFKDWGKDAKRHIMEK